jgi:hypothetical protein
MYVANKYCCILNYNNMSMSNLNLIAIVAIVASVSLFAGIVVAPIFAQGNSSGNNTRDDMGNFINSNNSSMTNNGHSLMKSYPTNSSI